MWFVRYFDEGFDEAHVGHGATPELAYKDLSEVCDPDLDNLEWWVGTSTKVKVTITATFEAE